MVCRCINQEMQDCRNEQSKFILCDKCGCQLHIENDSYYGDYVWNIDESYYCEDCKDEIVKSLFRVYLDKDFQGETS